MSQISPPLRILLAGSVLFLAAWFVLLRPSPPEAPPVTPTPAADAGGAAATTGSGQAVEAANEAASAANAKAGASAPATTQPVTKPQPQPSGAAPAVKPDLAQSGLPEAIQRDLGRKTMVLLFWNSDAADDRSVRRALRKVYRGQGDVVTHAVPVGRVSKYTAITRGAEVEQSPTTLVIDRRMQVTRLVGWTDRSAINQAVVDALRADGASPAQKAYVKQLEGLCSNVERQVANLDEPRSLKGLRRYVNTAMTKIARFNNRVRGVRAPKDMRRVHRHVLALVATSESLVSRVQTAARGGRVDVAALRRDVRKVERQGKHYDTEFAVAGLESCR